MKVREFGLGHDGHMLITELETLGGLYRIHSVMIPTWSPKRPGTGTITLKRCDGGGIADIQTVQEWTVNHHVANKFNYLMSTLEQPDDDMILDHAKGVADLADLITKMIELAATAAQIQWGVDSTVKTVNHSI